MTKEEAEKILRIMVLADGGCYICAGNLFEMFLKEFPEYKELANQIFIEEIGYDLVNNKWIDED